MVLGDHTRAASQKRICEDEFGKRQGCVQQAKKAPELDITAPAQMGLG
jgi:hypothetical protein